MSGSYVTPRLEHARVSDAMRFGVFSCPADASVRDAARTMSMHHVHSVVVNDGDGALLGVLSDAEVLDALLDPNDGETPLRDVVDRDAAIIGSDEPLTAAAELMRDRRLSHVLVRDPLTGRASGMLSTLDLAGILAWGEA